MKRMVAVLAVLVALTSVQAYAAPITFTGSSGNLAASATFDTSGSNLIVTLTNTSAADVLIPADILTTVFFTLDGDPALTPVSALLGGGSVVFFGPNGGGNVGGEWAYVDNAGAPGGADEGIGSAGFGIFGAANFGGPDLDNPTAVNGLNYGILSAGDNTATGNSPVTGDLPLIQNSVVFTLSGLPAGYTLGVSNVSFQYGTSLTEPNVPGKPREPGQPVPEPGTLLLMGSGLLGLGLLRRKIRR